MEELIKLEDVSKSYRNKKILSNINLSIFKGQTLAVIGKNGAGKSTLLKIIAGLSKVSGGRRIVKGDRLKLNIGYVPDRFPKLNFTPHEYILHMGKIEGLSNNHIDKVEKELFNDFNLNSMKDTQIKYLSKGTIQKVAVIQAMLSKPDILLLDEPLSGQDVDSQEKNISILEKLKSEGIAMVLACHEAYLVEKLADKTVKIQNAKMLCFSQDTHKNMFIVFKISEDFDLNLVKSFKGLLNASQNGRLANILVDPKYSDSSIMHLINMGCSIVSVKEG
ncbi:MULTISPECIES: ATP-binding cassette domain-containing protein [Clostridium]|uniref:ATP-binding cassette domain-containing protein n=1 Tax=Clostridium TaxID=1485 RepID=UPI0008240088|nr:MULTISPECIES: ABC transporter ATP-binding protein [Clostridium]PJI07743.1 ABC transporter ATP-binding protein [Clostridium sp. CT7]